jgi:hypothetical protein
MDKPNPYHNWDTFYSSQQFLQIHPNSSKDCTYVGAFPEMKGVGA